MRCKHPFLWSPRELGFTLLELMATVAVLGVLLAIGVPAFTETIRTNRLAAQANELIVALNLARSEATKRGVPVALCAADASQTGCAGVTVGDWSNGWLVFTDEGATAGSLEAGESLLQTSRRVTNAMQLSTGNLGFIRFASSGEPTNAAAVPAGTAVATFDLRPGTCSGTNVRRIVIERTGRSNLSKEACS